MDLGTLYRDIVETSQDGIWVIDPQGRTLYANRRIAELLGREPEELEHLTEFDALDEEGRRQFAEHLRELARGEMNPHEVECLWVRKDGRQLWVLVRETPLYDEQGNLQGYLHRVSDYSERRRLFDELRSSRELLAEAQRIAKVGSWDWDISRDVISASDELYALYGIPRDSFDGSYATFLEVVHPEDRHLVEAAIVDALAGLDSFDFEVRILRNGEVAWMRGRGEVFRNAQGVPVRAQGTHQDVTDAKQSELALRDLVAQNTLMQLLASAANEAETLIDLLRVAQPVLLQHDDWVRARGYVPDPQRPGELVQLHLDREERDADQARPELVAFERGLAQRACRERRQVWDETSRPGRPSIAFPVTLGAEIVAVLVISADEPFERHEMIRRMVDEAAAQLGRVAERERAASELAAARDAAMEASRQKSEFLATMSHEIRTPLNGVIGLTDLLLRTDLDPHQQRLASGTQVASRALLGVVNDILDFSKIEAGKLELENMDFEVRPVFDQVANVLAEGARGKGLELVVSCRPDVPEMLNGDPTRLGQVLTNLGSNAVKFTDEGEVVVRATAEECADGSTLLRVEVSDTGVGVDPDKREHIFDPFSQADASTTREYGGTGLGLAISKEIVTALDGEIGVDSAPGEGATFWFTGRFGSAGGTAGDRSTLPDSLAGRRVLVVDDNASNRLILSEHLGRWDACASTAPSAARALELMREAVTKEEPYDAVLLDLAMPECDGMHLAARVRADERLATTPLIMLASFGRPADDELWLAGVTECLTKPVLAGDVHDALVRALQAEPAPRRTFAARKLAPEQAAAERPLVLVVEDNPVNQLVALGILETLGYAADTADDGVAAVEAWRRGSYAAVLMDVQMPRMDGYAATRRIRELERSGHRTPVLAMTAAAVQGERDKCLAAGMDDFLTKPVNPEALGAMLRRWLRRGDDGQARAQAVVPQQARGQADVLDRQRLDMLRDLDPGDTSYLDRAIGNFVARVPESVEAIRSAVISHDAAALTHAAHRLKGSALNLGLAAVGQLAEELEMLGDAGTTTGATGLVEALEVSVSEAVTEVLGYQTAHRA